MLRKTNRDSRILQFASMSFVCREERLRKRQHKAEKEHQLVERIVADLTKEHKLTERVVTDVRPPDSTYRAV
jgi:hypothetical protein